jgi:hypothetical protein
MKIKKRSTKNRFGSDRPRSLQAEVRVPPRDNKNTPGFVMLAAIVLVIIGVGLACNLPVGSKPSDEEPDSGDDAQRAEAVDAAEQLVEDHFPQYASGEQIVSEREVDEEGKTIYVITYLVEPDEENGVQFPRGINIYVDPETHTISIEEMN